MNKQNLANQLTALVGDFGYDVVRETLGTVARKKSRTAKLVRKQMTGRTVNSPAKKLNAVAVVSSIALADNEKRDFLLHLAKNYEAKLFMPNVTHVRGFLMHDHDDPSRIKSRQQVTVRVFKKLAEMNLEELHDLELCGLYDPPKRLAAYAEAIEGFGRTRRAVRR